MASIALVLAACGTDGAEQAQVVAATATPIPTTPPVSAPTSTPVPTATPVPAPTATPLPTSTVAPTAVPAPTPEPAATPTAAPDVAPAPTVAPTATVAAEIVATPTPLPTATAEQADPVATAVTETPTAVVAAAGEPPLECFDRDVQVYRGFVEGVDVLTFEGGRVYCSGAGTNAVSVAGSYRHSSGLVVQRNGDFILNNAGTDYIPYSGTMHFCMNGQPASAFVVADSVPALLVVIDSEAQRQRAQGASGPVTFTASGTQC